MKPTDTFKFEMLSRLCAPGAPDTISPADVLPGYGTDDDKDAREAAQHLFSAVQSLESLRIVRMEKSKHDNGTFVDSVTLENPTKAARELDKLQARIDQENAEQAYHARQAEERSGRGRRGRNTSQPDPRITEEAAEYLDEVDAPLTPRELSLLVTGDTKKLDKTGLKRVAQTLRRKNSAVRSNVGALAEAGVVADLKTICIKGPVVLITQKGAVDASILPNGISMFDADLANIDRAYVRAEQIITVENLDAYRRCNDDVVYIYTQGSVSPRHRALLRMIHEQNPDVSFAHFGDIDYAGLKAHQVIEETLGCEVGLFHMGIAELANPAYRKAIHPLTTKDRELLGRLLEFERYRGLVSYMLERNVKLEQEIVALDLYSDYDVDSAMAALPAGRDEEAKEGGSRRSREGTYRKQSQRLRRRGSKAEDRAEENAPKAGESKDVDNDVADAEAADQEQAQAEAPEAAAEEPKSRRRRRTRSRKAADKGEAAEAGQSAEENAAGEQEAVQAQADAVEAEPEVDGAASQPEAAEEADAVPAVASEPEVRDVHPGRASRRRRSKKAVEAAPESVEDAVAEEPATEAESEAADAQDAAEEPKPKRRRRGRKPRAAQVEETADSTEPTVEQPVEAADASVGEATEAVDAPTKETAEDQPEPEAPKAKKTPARKRGGRTKKAAKDEAPAQEAPADETPAKSSGKGKQAKAKDEAPAKRPAKAQETPAPEPAEEDAKPAVSKAAQARKLRGELLNNLNNGVVAPMDVLDAVDDVARSITVVRFLAALPGWDKSRAQAFMEEQGISAGRTLRGLGKRQRERVVAAVNGE